MATVLAKAYPSMQMDLVCRLCRGKPEETLKRFRCGLCKKCNKDYRDEGLEREIEELAFLRTTWEKCRIFKQITTGITKLDFVLEVTFGKPHSQGWRDYSKLPPKQTDPHLILRLVGDSDE